MTAPLTLQDRAAESAEDFVRRVAPDLTVAAFDYLVREVELRDEARSPQAQVVAEAPVRSSER